MCPVCGCTVGSTNDPVKPWIVQHMVQTRRGLQPADEILCNECYSWFAHYMDSWRKDPDTPTRKLMAIGGNPHA